MFEAELRELGLTSNEIKVYLALLRHTALNPTRLAEVTGLHRSYIYDTLDRLLERGIVNTVLVGKKKHYQAQDPKVLRDGVEMQLKQLDQVLPQLSQLFTEQKEETRIELHKGRRAFRTMLKDIAANVRHNDTILILSVDEDFASTVEPIYLKQYFTVLQENDTKERIVIAEGGTRLPEPHIDYREIDPAAFGGTMTTIHQNKVYLFHRGDPMHLIVIESQRIADSHRKQFEFLWNLARP